VTQVDISGDFMTLMTPDGNTKEDTRLPEGELGSQIQSEFESGKELLITCVSAVGMEQVSCYFFTAMTLALICGPGYLFQGSTSGLLNFSFMYYSWFGHILTLDGGYTRAPLLNSHSEDLPRTLAFPSISRS